MKILVCVQEYPPYGSGIGNVAYNVVRRLEQQGHECTVLDPVALNFSFSNIRRFAGIGLLFFWHKVANYLRRNGGSYDVIWVHNPLFLKKITMNNIFSTVHTTYSSRMSYVAKKSFFVKSYYRFMKFMESLAYQKNKFKSNVISLSTKKELYGLGLKPKYIPNGVDTKIFTGKTKKYDFGFDFDSNTLYALCVGRVAYQKNPFESIEFFEKLNEFISVKLLWVGAGELFDEAKTYIRTNDIKNTILVGKVPYDEIPKVYSSVDFFFLGSVYEGQPLVLLEAMSSRLPCIVSNLDNLADLVNDSNCGFVTNLKDVEPVVNYLSSPKFKNDGTRARVYAKSIDWDLIAKKYLQWFKE